MEKIEHKNRIFLRLYDSRFISHSLFLTLFFKISFSFYFIFPLAAVWAIFAKSKCCYLSPYFLFVLLHTETLWSALPLLGSSRLPQLRQAFRNLKSSSPEPLHKRRVSSDQDPYKFSVSESEILIFFIF